MNSPSKQPHGRFLSLWLIILFLLLGAVGLFNWVVDPYGLFDSHRIEGFNALKPTAADHLRVAKPYQVTAFSPRTVIGGNSRPEMGLDPGNACWAESDRPVFNMGLPGASVFQQARFLQHALDNQKTRQVFWGLDFIDFMGPHEGPSNRWKATTRVSSFEKRLKIGRDGQPNGIWKWQSMKDHFQALFSLNTLEDSMATIIAQGDPHASDMRRDGFNPARNYMDIIHWEGQWVLFAQKRKELEEIFSRPDLTLYEKEREWSWQFESVRRLLKHAASKNVRVVLFINPYHLDYLKIIHAKEHWKAFESWKHRLTAVAHEADVELWDFSVIDERTMEAVPPRGNRRKIMQWFWEPAHYRRELGDVMLSRMLDRPCTFEETGHFGHRLLPQTIDARLAEARKKIKELMETNQ